MKKIALFTGEENSFDKEMKMFKLNNTNNIKIETMNIFSSNSRTNRIIRNLKGNIVKYSINKKLFEDDFFESYDTLIFFECVVKNEIIKYIRKQSANIRIIIYFRNQFDYSKKRNLSLKILKKLNCEFWSYNMQDCKKYNFKYNSQFWNSIYMNDININRHSNYIFSFLGRLKGREKELEFLNKYAIENKKKTFFYLVPKSNYSFDKNVDNKYMDYLDYLKIISESDCVIDLVSSKNYGLTLRPLEACFMKKKLITNYSEIKNYDFYNKNNIFILGEDKIEDLNLFLSLPFYESEEIFNYDFSSWILNFFK